MDHQMYSLGDSIHFQGLGGDSQLLGLSLQDMIDSDMKADFDDINCSNSMGNFANMDTFELLNDFNFKIEDGLFCNDNSGLLSNQSMGLNTRTDFCDSSLSNSSAFSNSYLEDMTGERGVMVNPNNVMPVNHHQQNQIQQQQPHQQQQQQHRLPATTQLNVSTTQYSSLPHSLAHQSTGSFVSHPPVIMSQAHFNGLITTSAGSRGIKTLKIMPPMSSPMQQVPSPSSSTLTSSMSTSMNSHAIKKKPMQPQQQGKENGFPKPAYSYSCLIALALKNSHTGCLSVSEIYKFMCEHFPYFKTAPSGWKNSVRHNLSLNKCFEKIEKPNPTGSQRKGCLWAMNPDKITKMEEEVAKWSRKDPMGIKKGMVMPETLEALERGEMKKDYSIASAETESEDDEDPRTPTSVSSQGSSQGDDLAGADFVDVEGFTAIPDSSLPELNLQVSGGIFEEFETSQAFCNGNYTITSVVPGNGEQKSYNMLVLHKQDGQKIFSI